MAAGATYEPLATTTLGSANSTITFSSIPSTYTDLRLVVTGNRVSGTAASTVQFNSDTATNYSSTYIEGNGSTATSGRTTSGTYIFNLGLLTSSNPCLAVIDIFSYAGSTYKSALMSSSADQNGSGYVDRLVGLWRSTSAITTITLSQTNNFSIGTTATLYGITKA